MRILNYVLIVGLVLNPMTSTALAQIASVPNNQPIQQSNNNTLTSDILTPEHSRQTIEAVVHDEAFSKKIETTKWEEINPKPQAEQSTPGWWEAFWQSVFEKLGKKNEDGLKGASLMAGITKLIILLALFGFLLWLYKTRDTWLAWFRRAARLSDDGKSAEISPHLAKQYAPIWQGLPERDRLINAIDQALSQQQWLMALSLLYRGTLREILQVHQLPITRATTEAQCSWLLRQAPTRQPAEAQFFTALVTLWSQVAYGQKIPATAEQPTFKQTILQLTTDWQRLYLNAPRSIISPTLISTPPSSDKRFGKVMS